MAKRREQAIIDAARELMEELGDPDDSWGGTVEDAKRKLMDALIAYDIHSHERPMSGIGGELQRIEDEENG